MTDIPPPQHIKYCTFCMSKHNSGWVMRNKYPEQGVCSSCGKPLPKDVVKEDLNE